MPTDPFDESDGTATKLMQIAVDGAECWYTRCAAVLSLVQIAQMDHCKKGRAKILQWVLERMEILNGNEDIHYALVSGLGILLTSSQEQIHVGDAYIDISGQDEAVLLRFLEESSSRVLVNALSDLKARSIGLVDWVVSKQSIERNDWPAGHVLLLCSKTAAADDHERALSALWLVLHGGCCRAWTGHS